jgi:hypothetical protein
MTVRELEELELWIGAASRILSEAVYELPPVSMSDRLPDRYEPLRSNITEVEARLRKLHQELLLQICVSRHSHLLINERQ